MEIFDSISPILTTLTAQLVAHFDGPQATLQALAIAGAVVILLLFVIARRQGQATQRAASLESEPLELGDLAFTAELDIGPPTVEQTPIAPAEALAVAGTKPDNEPGAFKQPNATNVDGFVFHRRNARNTARVAQLDDADPEVALAAIEEEMLATRQLFLDGVISKEVYVAETRNLYGKAQQKM